MMKAYKEGVVLELEFEQNVSEILKFLKKLLIESSWPFVYSLDCVRPTYICLAPSTCSNVNLIQKHPQRHPQNHVLQITEHPVAQSSRYTISHPRSQTAYVDLCSQGGWKSYKVLAV